MSFPVALQSAIFYVIACTPCAKIRHRKRARQEAKEREKTRVETTQPGLYRHPDPFTTNPYWSEEIMLGPSLPRRSAPGHSKNTSQRALNSAGSTARGTSMATTRSSLAVNGNAHPPSNPEASPAMASQDENIAFQVHGPSETDDEALSEDWNHKRYQREDEELWGHDGLWPGHKLVDAIVKAGSSAGRLLEGKLLKEKPVTDEDRHNFYFSPVNPPVNDYHPPVVSSRPHHKDAHQWMLQPPPSAKVMEGKIPVKRSISVTSSISRKTTGESAGLGRLVHERMVEAKIRNGEAPSEAELSNLSLNRPPSVRRSSTARSAARTHSQRTARSRSISTESDDSLGTPSRRRKPRAQPPAMTPEVESEGENGDVEHESMPMPRLPKTGGQVKNENTAPGHAAQKPRLETIMSSESGEQVGLPREQTMGGSQRAASVGSTLEHKGRNGWPTGSSTDSGLALSEVTA